MPSKGDPAERRIQLLKSVFEAMDVDDNGRIDLAEYKRSAGSGNADELEIQHWGLDSNGDGKLNYDEWSLVARTRTLSSRAAALSDALTRVSWWRQSRGWMRTFPQTLQNSRRRWSGYSRL